MSYSKFLHKLFHPIKVFNSGQYFVCENKEMKLGDYDRGYWPGVENRDQSNPSGGGLGRRFWGRDTMHVWLAVNATWYLGT